MAKYTGRVGVQIFNNTVYMWNGEGHKLPTQHIEKLCETLKSILSFMDPRNVITDDSEHNKKFYFQKMSFNKFWIFVKTYLHTESIYSNIFVSSILKDCLQLLIMGSLWKIWYFTKIKHV